MKFLCLGYLEENLWDTLLEGERLAAMNECLAYDEVLGKHGHLIDKVALQSARTAKTLRWAGSKVVVTDGPYAETKEQLGGLVVREFKNMDQAVELMSRHPAVRRGVTIEVRPAVAEMDAPYLKATADAPRAQEGTERFVCLGYMEEQKWEVMSKTEQDAFIKECMAFDDGLRKNGHWVSGEALQSVRTAKTLRWKQGKLLVTDGPYAETKEQLGGVVVLEAGDINHVTELMFNHPGIRRGVHLEIRPVGQPFEALDTARKP
jgi:hypothetical protein